jgi:WXG100 family type VII secretion target
MTSPNQINTAVMYSASTEIGNAGQDIVKAGNSMQDAVAALMRTYTGESANEFKRAMEEYSTVCTSIERQLRLLSGNVEHAARDYDNAHARTTDQSASLASNMAAPEGLSNF